MQLDRQGMNSLTSPLDLDGTAEELLRFKIARQLAAEDAAAFETRIDERLASEGRDTKR